MNILKSCFKLFLCSKAPRKSSLHAFTLTEILFVIPCILVIAAMAVAAVGGGREAERTAACMENMRRIHKGSMLYAQDYDEWILPSRTMGGKMWSEVLPENYGINPRSSNAQVKNHDGMRCPSENRTREQGKWQSDWIANQGLAPYWLGSEWQDEQYSRMHRLSDVEKYVNSWGVRYTPETMIWYADGNNMDRPPKELYAIIREEQDDRGMALRHEGHGNAVFVAGNVETLSEERVLELYPNNLFILTEKQMMY